MRAVWQLVPGGGPTIEPLPLPKVLQQLRLGAEPADLDRLLDAIRGARFSIEQYLHRGLLTQKWRYQQDEWTDEIQLPMAAPLQSVESVKYFDGAGNQITLDPSMYIVDTMNEPGRILRGPLKVWPILQVDRVLAVEVNYTVGWESPDDIPGNIIDACYALMAARYENREPFVVGSIVNELPDDVAGMLPDRVFWTPPMCEAAS